MSSKIKYIIPPILWAAFIFIVSFIPTDKLPEINVVNFDKVVHAGVYFMLIFLLWLYVPKIQQLSPIRFLFLCAICILFGFTVELLQGTFTETRQFDWYDIVANSLGVLLFAVMKQKIFVRLR